MTSADRVTSDVLQIFEDVRSRTFARLEGLTDAEYLWQPVGDCMTVRRAEDGVFRADPPLPGDYTPLSDPPDTEIPAPVTTIAWRVWHIGSDCLRGYLRFFDDALDLGDRYEWPDTADQGVLALAEDWARFVSHVEALGDARLLAPMGPRAGAFAEASFLALALHALDEAAHHGGEIGLLRDLHLRQGG
jgi:hypothetical protein